MENEKKKLTGKKKLLITLAVILSVLLICSVAVFIFVDSILGDLGRLDSNSTLSPEELESLVGDATGDTIPDYNKAEPILKGNDVINILLVGQDRRSGEAKRTRSDAMILCTINTSENTLTMTSFMRDLWVYIPDHYNNRLNVPYAKGGFKLLNQTLEYNFGISADYNVEIDFNGFMEAIDAVGGVEIELTSAEANYLNDRGNWDLEENQNWNLKKGVNLLNGSQALAYSRIRKIDSDFRRTERQRVVLTALLEKAETLSVTELYDLVKRIVPMLATDMTGNQIWGLVLEMLPMLSDLNVVSQRIPLDGKYSYANKNGASVITLSAKDLEAVRELLTQTMD